MKSKFTFPDFLIVVLTFACQFWTLKFELLSLPILLFVILGTASLSTLKKIESMHIFFLIFLCVSLGNANIREGAGIFHYSYFFGAICIYFILIFICMTKVVIQKSYKELGSSFFLAIFLAFGVAILITPEKLLVASDGDVGLFNEKGLFSYYIVLMASAYWCIRRSLVSIIILATVLMYCLIIQEALRVILPFLGVILVWLSVRLISFKVACFSMLVFVVALYFTHESLLVKLVMMVQGGGIDGRYAASTILITQGSDNLIMGNGFHSYIGNRFDFLPMPGDFPYDYPGSMVLEMIYEIGIPMTLIMISLVTKAVFGRMSLFGWISVLIIFAGGGKQDILMWYTLLVFCYLHKYLKEYAYKNIAPLSLK